MTKSKRISGGMARVQWVVAFLALLLVIPVTSQAEILEAELRVNGMSCPFCAFGIEKKLRRVDGVQEVDVLLDEGRVRLTFRADNAATVDALEDAVGKAGFQLSGMKLKVRGILTTKDSKPILDAAREARFWLLESDNGRTKPISGEALERLQHVAGNGMLVVNGMVHTHVDGLPGLVISGAESAGGETG